MRGVCALDIRVGAKKLVKEESAVSISELIQTTSERQETKGQNMADGLVRELFDELNDLILAGDATEEDERKELYAIAASVFA